VKRVYQKIRSEIERRGLSVTEAAVLLNISRPAFSNVVNGNASLSIELAFRLEREFRMRARALLIQQLNEQIEEETK
jgi:plasmid maintenance system antidote protein VapI